MISVNSFTDISAQSGPYVFELNRCTVIVCKLNDLPEFNENDRVLLDIDLDFFSDYKKTASIDDPQVAAIAWMAGWERPAWASRNEQFRRTQAMMFYQQLGSVSFTGQPGVVSSSTSRNDSYHH